MELPKTLTAIESLNAGEIAELWATLAEAAKSDAKAREFLVMFEPWARERIKLLII